MKSSMEAPITLPTTANFKYHCVAGVMTSNYWRIWLCSQSTRVCRPWLNFWVGRISISAFHCRSGRIFSSYCVSSCFLRPQLFCQQLKECSVIPSVVDYVVQGEVTGFYKSKEGDVSFDKLIFKW